MISLTIFCLFISLSENRLIMVQQLFRHGARYPIFSTKSDQSYYTDQEKSWGQLTRQGKKMHYLLGIQMYTTYWDQLFLGTPYYNQYNQSKFFIKSTDVNRTIQSAQSHLMGVYSTLPLLVISDQQTKFSEPMWPNTKANAGVIFENATNYHPTAIHVQKIGTSSQSQGDFLRTYDSKNCPRQIEWAKQNLKTPFALEIAANQNFKQSIQDLSDQLGFNVLFQYYDNYQCQKYMGKPYLRVFDKYQNQRALDKIRTLSMYIAVYSNREQIRATATGFFQATVNNIKTVIKDSNNSAQWVIYSAHDTTVSNMLTAMNMTNVQCIYQAYLKNISENSDTCVSQYPLFTSSIIFQLYENAGVYTFKIKYNGQDRKIPFCNYRLECQVANLFQWFDEFADLNFLKSCNVKGQNISNNESLYFSIMIIELAIITIVFIFVVIRYLKKKRLAHNEKNKSNILNQQVINPVQSF